VQKLTRRAERKKKKKERERERVPWEQTFKRPYLWISPLDWFGVWIYYGSHYPLTSDRWDLNVLLWCERYSPRNISRKTCLQVSHGHWQFPPFSTVGSCLIFDTWVILMSFLLWTVEIGIRDFNKKLFIGE